MSKKDIVEELRPLNLSFSNDLYNLVVIPTVADGNCYFHSILRAFNVTYINAKDVFIRINLVRSFRNGLADRLSEIDPVTGEEYYKGLDNGRIAESSKGVLEHSKEYLRKELLSSNAVDIIYQELISNCINKDIYIVDGETNDIYTIGPSYNIYYKGRNSILIYYTSGHFETIGIKRSDGSINTVFTPEHPLIQSCRERLIEEINKIKKRGYLSPRGLSPKVTTLRGTSPRR